MTSLPLTILLLLLGVALLAKGADWLVGGSSEIARRMGVTALVIGLTVVAWGTSAPEVVVSAKAAWAGKAEMSLGNVLGSNVANIGLVLGATSILLPAVLDQKLQLRESFWLLAAVVVLWVVALDVRISRFDGALLVGVFALHNIQLLWSVRRDSSAAKALAQDAGAGSQAAADASAKRRLPPGIAIVMGMIALAIGAELTVRSAEALARRFGVSDHVIGFTVIAVGTSLPELVAGAVAALRRESEIGLGNVVGSNVFNLSLALGLTALIQPFDPHHRPARESVQSALNHDLPAVLGFSLAAIVLPRVWPGRFGGWKGFVLLVAYGTYVWTLF